MKHFIRTITVIISFSMIWIPSKIESCTFFCLKKRGTVLVGKNLDWPIGDGFVIINKKGIAKRAMVDSEENAVQWTSKYGSITFNLLGKEFPLSGMNENGLIVGELSYSPSIYPENHHSDCLNELQWIQYQLDNYSTTEEVINNLNQTAIKKFLFGLHYFVCDGSGSTAVIEFIDGKVLVYSGQKLPYPVLTNNSYANLMKYLKMHRGFGGKRMVSEGPESPERFVRAAEFVQNFISSGADSPIECAFDILSNVKQSDTQWSLVYNPIDLEISFRTKGHKAVRKLDMKTLDFEAAGSLAYSLFENGSDSQNIISGFTPLTRERNEKLVSRFFKKMVLLGEIDSERALTLRNKMMEYQE